MTDRAEFDALRSELISLRREVRRRRRVGRLLPCALLVALLAVVPMALGAANPFNDLNPGSPHNDNIGLIYDAGITRGCDPGVAYCPNANVTREEMASFLARVAGLGSNPPVVNAKTAQNSTQLNGQPASAYQLASQPAANALQLGGQPASAYRPAGQSVANADNALTLRGYSPAGITKIAVPASATLQSVGNAEVVLTSVSIAIPGPTAQFVTMIGRATVFTYANPQNPCPCDLQLSFHEQGIGLVSNLSVDEIDDTQAHSKTIYTIGMVVATPGTHTYQLVARTLSPTSGAIDYSTPEMIVTSHAAGTMSGDTINEP